MLVRFEIKEQTAHMPSARLVLGSHVALHI